MCPPLFQTTIDKGRIFILNTIFKFVAVLAVAGWFAAGAFAQLPDCYHRLDQVYDFIFELDANDSLNRVHIDSIGHSRGDQLGVQYPIYAVKISDNADTFEDEPVMLVICHIHAEELLGLELCLDYMRDLVQGQYMQVLNVTQIYFIPTMNPDGLQVISYGVPQGDSTVWDLSWRKNGYHPPQWPNDCNVAPGMGGELCGVDLNRNFELNWVFGDTLWRPTSSQVFDYYRGPSAFSEPECRAVRDFAMEIKPALSIVYHMSRGDGQGHSIGEQCITAWKWGDDPGPYKYPADCTAIGNINRRYAVLLDKEDGLNHYDYVQGGTHNGCLQDWFYWRLGTIQILTELGPQFNIQPACDYMYELIDDDRASLYWLHRRLVNLDVLNDMNGVAAVLKIYTRDATPPNPPISAEWRNVETWNEMLAPWYTNEQFGRATFHPPTGQITIMARKEGYADTTASTNINPSGQQILNLYLRPLTWYPMTFQIRNAAGEGVQGNVYLDCEFPKWISVPTGGQTVSLPEGNYQATIIPDDQSLMVMWREFELAGDGALDVWCPSAASAFNENFANGLGNWTSGGEHNFWRADTDTTVFNYWISLYSNPATGPVWPYVYENGTDAWAQYSDIINVPGGNVAMLQFDRRGRMDVPADSLYAEISLDGSEWIKVGGYCDLDIGWTKTYADLSPWMPNNFFLRFRLTSDEALGELGMHIDNVRVLYATDLVAPKPPETLPMTYRITSAYPNPFNPSTTIRYEAAGAGVADWNIYNITGQLVRQDRVTIPAAGYYSFRWDGANERGTSVPTGLYLIQMRMNGHVSTQKVLLMR